MYRKSFRRTKNQLKNVMHRNKPFYLKIEVDFMIESGIQRIEINKLFEQDKAIQEKVYLV